MDKQTFIEDINKIMHYGLSLHVIDGMETSHLRNLFIDPENHIKSRLIISKNPIDIREQKRNWNALIQSENYKNLMKAVSKLKKDSSWMKNIQLIQIYRNSDGLFVRL